MTCAVHRACDINTPTTGVELFWHVCMYISLFLLTSFLAATPRTSRNHAHTHLVLTSSSDIRRVQRVLSITMSSHSVSLSWLLVPPKCAHDLMMNEPCTRHYSDGFSKRKRGSSAASSPIKGTRTTSTRNPLWQTSDANFLASRTLSEMVR